MTAPGCCWLPSWETGPGHKWALFPPVSPSSTLTISSRLSIIVQFFLCAAHTQLALHKAKQESVLSKLSIAERPLVKLTRSEFCRTTWRDVLLLIMTLLVMTLSAVFQGLILSLRDGTTYTFWLLALHLLQFWRTKAEQKCIFLPFGNFSNRQQYSQFSPPSLPPHPLLTLPFCSSISREFLLQG